MRERAEVVTVQQDVQQGKLFQVTMFCIRNLHFEEGNRCFELDRNFEFVNEQHFALQNVWNEEAMYQKLCHVAMKHNKQEKGHAKGETHTMNEPFGKKTDFDFEVSLVEEAIQSNNNVWKLWTGKVNSGINAVAQANGIDNTQLSNGHRKQQNERIGTVERISNLRREMEKREKNE